MSPDRYKKEDPERAEAVIETVYRRLVVWADGGAIDQADIQTGALRDLLWQQKIFLMDVFRAVRGET